MCDTSCDVKINAPSSVKNKNICFGRIRLYGKEYCHNTSIHGFKYLGGDSTLFEKIWWLIVLVTSFTGCIMLIYMTYRKWESKPVIVTFATEQTPLYEIPFPAVTICPQTKFQQSLYNYTHLYHMVKHAIPLSEEETAIYNYVLLLCNDNLPHHGVQTSNHSLDMDDFSSFLQSAVPQIFPPEISICKYLGMSSRCSRFFKPILLDEGLCFTYNILDRIDFFTDIVIHQDNFHETGKNTTNWDYDSLLYKNKDQIFSYPNRALLAGAKASFSITLRTLDEDIDYICRKSLQGYKVLLHHPVNIPRLSTQFFTIPLDHSVFAAIEPVIVTTSNNLVFYDAKVRGCFFSNERKLRYFRAYTEENCKMECITNFTKDYCKCVAFYMPRDATTSVCSDDKFKCVGESEIILMSAGVLSKFNDDVYLKDIESFGLKRNKVDCNCLPACTSIDYKVEISQTNWDWKKVYEVRGEEYLLNGSNSHLSRLELFFKTNHIIALERNELYGPTDFLANFGGLLGLFTGFSLISLMEIVYFLTLRLISNLWMWRRQTKSKD